MAYDEVLAERIRTLVAADPGLSEKKMFGGLAFLINGHMAIAASGQGGLLVRIDPARTEEVLASTEAEMMEMRGKSMPGWLRVKSELVSSNNELRHWIELSTTYANSLPPKA